MSLLGRIRNAFSTPVLDKIVKEATKPLIEEETVIVSLDLFKSPEEISELIKLIGQTLKREVVAGIYDGQLQIFLETESGFRSKKVTMIGKKK